MAEDEKTPETEAAEETTETPAEEAPAEETVVEETVADEAPAAETAESEAPAKTVTDLADLGEAMAGAATAEPAAPTETDVASPSEPQIDGQGRSYATGKRKDAVARVWIKPGKGMITVNKKPIETYFARPVLRMMIGQPFQAAARDNQYDVICTVTGGGLSGQAGAVRHGISQALARFEPSLRPTLKKGGFLTRDARVVERKKYGKRKARRSFQFSKR